MKKVNYKCKCGYDWDEQDTTTSECPECNSEVEGVELKLYRMEKLVTITEEVWAPNPVKAIDDVWEKGKEVCRETLLERGMPVDNFISQFEDELTEEQKEEAYDLEDREHDCIPGIYSIEEVA